MTARRVDVFGPAYLDRVLLVDRPLSGPAPGPPLDQSVDGALEFGPGAILELRGPEDFTIAIDPPPDWPGPTGVVRLEGASDLGTRGCRAARGVSWRDDLGGMGAGYASALSGRLFSALGAEDDPRGRAISRMLVEHAIAHRAARVPGIPSDWTLLVTSGPHGDKLPIGFRGCHARLAAEAIVPLASSEADLRVVAALPNRLAAALLAAPGDCVRFFAPTMRNVVDRERPISGFLASIDVLSCNRREWGAAALGPPTAGLVPVLVVTDGPKGADLWFRTSSESNEHPHLHPHVHVPAFPRDRPPLDTNRAGEAFTSELLKALLERGWGHSNLEVDEELMRHAACRASAAAGLVLDRPDFGFPTTEQIDEALRAGKI